MWTTVFLSAFYASLIFLTGFALQKKIKSNRIKAFFWPAFILKLLAGVAFGFIYFHFLNSGDTYEYFVNSVKLAELVWANPEKYFSMIFNLTI